MLVEDEAVTALCIRDSLEHLGYAVVATITRGEEAVRQAAELQPDLILMDITLADATSGIEAAEQIQQTQQQIPIIFMTAHSDTATLARAKRIGPFGYLTKPYHLDNLKSTIEIALYKSAADAKVRESEARYKKLFHEFETIVNGIPDAMTLWSPEMRLLWANKGALEQFGKELPELLEKNCRDICVACHDQPQGCEVRRCFRSQAIENKLQTDEEGRTWGVKAFPLIDNSGAVTQVIRLASDLTERMHLREEAARSAHLAALGELAAGMAHEINNPTGLILLEMPILRDAFRDARPILEAHFLQAGDFSFAGMKYSEMREEIGPMIDEITEGAQRIKRIVNELKDFSRPVEGNPFVAVDLNEVVRKASALVAGRIKKLTDNFTIAYAAEAVMVTGNFQKLEQVLINLIVNACQSLPHRSGKVTVEIAAAPQRGLAKVTVRDEGTGIQPEHLKVITDPFFTTRRESGGTGLGLSVSMRIVEEHQGTLRFDSAPQRGTVVTLELPLAEKLEA
jgi:signal transduction histidine kinase/AmiR/NasT family two-component response regulator